MCHRLLLNTMNTFSKQPPTYWIMKSERHGQKHVPTGVSIYAAVFGPFWAASKGAIAIMCGMIGVNMVIYIAHYGLGNFIPQNINRGMFSVFQSLYTASVLIYANRWYKRELEGDGYTEMGHTRMKSETPPDFVGDVIVEQYAMRTWVSLKEAQDFKASDQHIGGYVIGHHENDKGLLFLVECGANWSAQKSTAIESKAAAMEMVSTKDRLIHSTWVAMPTSEDQDPEGDFELQHPPSAHGPLTD